jgi:pimeloyl-ACP methyl ester carboxylesterase
MFRNFLGLVAAAATQAYAADVLVLPPSAGTTGEEVAIVWIHGADCDPAGYTAFANEIQATGAEAGQKIWVGLPKFLFDIPEPLLINGYVKDTLDEIRAAGFTGDQILIAGHSLGGVMTQDYAQSNLDFIKGQILMGSVLTRDKHTLNDDGSTHWNYDVPTLTLGGTKDGLMRVTRLTEAYWHQIKNVESAQAGKFPIYAMEGTSHMSYMTGDAPRTVRKHDLQPDVEDATAWATFAPQVVKFISNVVA